MASKKNNVFTAQKIIFSFYFYIVLAITAFLMIFYHGYQHENIIFIISLIAFIPLSFFITHFAFKLSQKIKILSTYNKSFKSKAIVFVLVFIVSFGFFLLWFIGYKPGVFTIDPRNQYQYVIDGIHTDWHPFLHTFVVFELPLKIFKSVDSIVLCQIVFFALAIAFLIETIFAYSNIYFAIGSFLFIILNPNTCNISVVPIKDVTFTILCIIVYGLLFRFYMQKIVGKKIYICILIMTIGLWLMFAFRHNGIIVSLAIIILAFFILNKKQWYLLLTSFIVVLLIFLFPIKSIFSVPSFASVDKRPEIYGHVISAYKYLYKYELDTLDDQTKDILFSIAPAETWDEFVDMELFDLTSDINPYNSSFLLKWKKNLIGNFFKNPTLTLWGFLQPSSYIYSLSPETFLKMHDIYIHIAYNQFPYTGDKNLYNFLDSYSSWKGFNYLFGSIGFLTLIFIFMGLSKCNLSKKYEWTKFLWLLPIFLYDISTIIYSINFVYRYFYFQFLLLPLYVLIFYSEKQKLYNIGLNDTRKVRDHNLF